MKKEILKIAGVKSEKEFYKKYPTKAAFMKAHKKEFKKAAMGKSMVQKQLTQLTDYANPPQAEIGAYIGGEQAPAFKAANYTELYDQADYANTGMNRKMRMEQAALEAQQQIAENTKKKGGILDMLGQLAPQLDALSPDAVNISTPSAGQFAAADADMNANFAADIAGGMRYGGHISRAQDGFWKGLTDFSNKAGKSIGQGYDKVDKGLGKVGGVTGSIPIVGDLVQGFQQLKQERDLKRQARQSFELSGLTKQVAGLAPDIKQRKYVRPEDQAFGTQQIGQTYGAGTNFLAANGAMIGGNPTEIQNMYNPGDLYSDLGYEPLGESGVVKQYRRGGHIPRAQFGDAGNALGSWIGGGHGRPTAGGKIGGTIGSTIGKFIPVPGAPQALEFIGSTVGSIFGGKSAKQTEKYQTGAEQNTQDAAFTQGVRGMQGQFNNVMEDGGWVSHNWQPQVITQFGGYDMKDLLRPDETMDTLRAGGHLKLYTAPSEAAMFTGKAAMGGNLKTTWGGYAEPISQNPYLPGSGETVMFRGQSHDESDGNGNTGIGVKYGKGIHDSYTDYAEYGTAQADADVEVERNEPAVELPDSETGGESMVVFGNMKIPKYVVSELGDKNAKDKKFKTYASDLSKIEDRQNKIIEKGVNIMNSIEGDNPYDMLKFNSAKAMVEGGNMKQKEIAYKKMLLAIGQNAILDTAEEMGLENDALAKGKIKPIKNSDMAKFGGKFTKAQVGANQPLSPIWPMSTYYRIDPKTDLMLETSPELKKAMETKSASKKGQSKTSAKTNTKVPERPKATPITSIDIPKKGINTKLAADAKAVKAALPEYAKNLGPIAGETKQDKANLLDLYNALYPLTRPVIKNPLDPNQLSAEMFALSTNQLDPVAAQTFQPLLEQPYSVSLQDQLNEIQADVNASKRLVGNNPAALAAIDAQAYNAKNKVLAEQFRINQTIKMETMRRNIGMLNDATLKNLAILDQQYGRQQEAQSKTKAVAQTALASIADKIGKNKSETLSANVMANMYPQFAFGPKGRIFNTGVNKFNIPTVGDMTIDDLKKELKDDKDKTAKNGSLVKAIKNL